MAEVQQQQANAKGGKRRSRKMGTRLDMTPMVDLAFLLLTFFMLTTTFTKLQTMELNMPAKAPDPGTETVIRAEDAFTVILGENNRIFYYFGLADDQPEVVESDYSAAGIRKVLNSDRIKSRKKMVVMVKAMEKSRYRNLVDILDEIRITDTKKYALMDMSAVDLELVRSKMGE